MSSNCLYFAFLAIKVIIATMNNNQQFLNIFHSGNISLFTKHFFTHPLFAAFTLLLLVS